MPGEHLILYDGVCGLCTRSVSFVLPRDRRHAFDYAALQSATGRRLVKSFGRDPGALNSFFVVTNYRTTPALLDKSAAALFVARALGLPWRAAGVFRLLPRSWLDWAYDVVARHRYQVFGRRDTCMLPTPDQRARFIDHAPEKEV
jgi:predicted DCC family thiol-disulfide oxidoreductase YuxK